jgi:hypothetical protein
MITGWFALVAWLLAWPACDSQQPTCPHDAHIRRLRVLGHSSHVEPDGAWSESGTWAQAALGSAPIERSQFMPQRVKSQHVV